MQLSKQLFKHGRLKSDSMAIKKMDKVISKSKINYQSINYQSYICIYLSNKAIQTMNEIK